MILALVIANVLSGVGTTVVGYYAPFFYVSTILMAIGAGLLTTWETDTGHSMWIGYQVLYGLGVGFGMQQALITVQTVLPLADIPTGTACVMFAQLFGGALFVSVAQNIFNQRLQSEIVRRTAGGVDPELILQVGATSLKQAVPQNMLSAVQEAYNDALTETWYVSVAMAALSILAWGIQWRSVKGMKPGAGGMA
jgi:hypothetical protein